MKNIHILPTDQPSRLWIGAITGKLILDKEPNTLHSQHIYITSDEDLILGGFHFNSKYGDEPQKTDQRDIDSRKYWEEEDYDISKIILTTDVKLIADGIQRINNDFLEWFVKNPTCEFIETKYIKTPDPILREHDVPYGYYKILIPQEELKKNFTEEWKKLEDAKLCKPLKSWDEPKQSTLEEAAKEYMKGWGGITNSENSFIAGAKWQAERMYSEEEVRKAIQLARLCTLDNVTGEFVDLSGLTEVCTYGLEETHSEDSIIEQFKKK
jgi:hypothetical protein